MRHAAKIPWLIMLAVLLPMPALFAVEPARPPEANRMRPGDAPTPYSAQQIRKACPDGGFVRFRIETPDSPAVFSVVRFLEGTDAETTLESGMEDAQGKPAGAPQTLRVKWTDLQGHASFHESDTRIEAASAMTPLGIFNCWKYTVRKKTETGESVATYWFAKDLPGPPVLLEEHLGGKKIKTMTQIERKPLPAAGGR